VLPRALYLLQAMLVARWLGPQLNGRVAYATALMMLVGTIGKFGLDTLTMREVAKQPALAARYVGHNLYLHAALGLLGLLLMGATTRLVDKTPDVDVLVGLMGAAMLLQSLSLSYTAVMAALERFELQALAEVLLYGLMLAGVVLALWLETGVVGVGVAMAAASALQLACCWHLARRTLGPADLRLDPALARSMLAMAWPLALTTAAVGVYTRIDSIFLSVLWNDVQVGLYDAAYNFIHGLRQLPAALSIAFFPALSRLVLQDRAQVPRATASVVRFGLIVGLPVVVLTSAWADWLIALVYRPTYLPAAGPLRILLWTVPLMLADGIQAYLLIAAGRQVRLLYVTLLGAAVNLALNAALIPAFGMHGAAVATLASEAAVLVAMQACVADLFPWPDFARSVRAPLLALAPLLAVAALAGGPGLAGSAALAAGLVLYGAVLVLGLDAPQRRAVLSAFRVPRKAVGA
jgi:O-antigen/teichoic acid export membrane protein